jgi:hypothetical protein
MVRRGRVHHVGEEHRDRRAIHQTSARIEPLGRVVARRPIVERRLEVVTEVAERQPAPDEEAIAGALRLTHQLEIEHRSA